MFRILPATIYLVASRLGTLQRDLTKEFAAANYLFSSKPSEHLLKHWNDTLEYIREMIDEMGLPQAAKRVERIEQRIHPLDIQGMLVEAKEMDLAIMSDINGHKVLCLAKENAAYYNQADLFKVATQFPSADEEIVSAGNCYATANYSACVFHLMRVVETGAKALVKALKAEKHILVPRQENGKTVMVKKPIELCDWKLLKDGMTKALAKLEGGTKLSLKKKQDLEYFSHAVSQFSLFKDAWRNKTAHSRHVYGAGEAKDIMENVRQFMVYLAKRVKE